MSAAVCCLKLRWFRVTGTVDTCSSIKLLYLLAGCFLYILPGKACRMYRRALNVCSKIPGLSRSTRSMTAGSIQVVGLSSLSPAEPTIASCDTGSEPGTSYGTKGIRNFRGSPARWQFQTMEKAGLRSFATGGISSKRPIPEKVQPYSTSRLDSWLLILQFLVG